MHNMMCASRRCWIEELSGRSQSTGGLLSSCPLNLVSAKFKQAENVVDASILKMVNGLNSALEQLYPRFTSVHDECECDEVCRKNR